MISDPIAGKIANYVEGFAGGQNVDMAVPQRIDINAFLSMLATNPVAAAANSMVTLRLLNEIGEYHHEDPAIVDFINYQFDQMEGSMAMMWNDMAVAGPIGWSSMERAIREPVGGEWLLESVALIPHRNHVFRGRLGRIESVLYTSDDGKQTEIPYSQVIHTVNRREVAAMTNTYPYGIGNCSLAIAAWKTWVKAIEAWSLASTRQATPILVGKEDAQSRAAILDANGQPLKDSEGRVVTITGTDRLYREMSNVDKNGGIIVHGLQGDVNAIQSQADGRIFGDFLHYLDKLISKAFLVPYTLLEEGSAALGNAGLASTQLRNMEEAMRKLAQQMQSEVMHKIIKPLIIWNLGEQESYGEWIQPQSEESIEERRARVEELRTLTQSFASGTFSTSDLDAVNRLRHLAGIPEIESIQDSLLGRTDYWRTRHG
jgi:hypothetical protein